MTTVSCPRCGDKVTAPANASAEAVVRCPLCNEEYPLDEALRSGPPMLIVVAPGPSHSKKDEEGALYLAPAEAPKPFVFEERPAPRKIAGRPRPQRREKNVFMEIFKVVAGGVVGLSIGQLILWWVIPGLQPGQRDPANLAPKLSRYVPWIIPRALRAPNEIPVSKRDFAETKSNRRSDRVASAPRNENHTMPSLPQRTDNRVPQRGAPDPLDSPPDLDPGKLEDLTPDSRPSGSDVNGAPGIANGPVIAAEEVKAALAAAQTSWNESSASEDLGKMRKALKHLARTITFADASDQDIQRAAVAARRLLRDIASNSQQLERLLATPDLSTTFPEKFPGRIVCGTLEEMAEAGRMFRSTLHTAEGHVDVVSVVDPHRSMNEGDRVLILGVDIQTPQQQLVGFEGDSAAVVFGGLVIKQPSQSPAEVREQPVESAERPPAPPRDGDTQSTLEEEARRLKETSGKNAEENAGVANNQKGHKSANEEGDQRNR
jgi:hypothetical protein